MGERSLYNIFYDTNNQKILLEIHDMLYRWHSKRLEGRDEGEKRAKGIRRVNGVVTKKK